MLTLDEVAAFEASSPFGHHPGNRIISLAALVHDLGHFGFDDASFRRWERGEVEPAGWTDNFFDNSLNDDDGLEVGYCHATEAIIDGLQRQSMYGAGYLHQCASVYRHQRNVLDGFYRAITSASDDVPWHSVPRLFVDRRSRQLRHGSLRFVAYGDACELKAFQVIDAAEVSNFSALEDRIDYFGWDSPYGPRSAGDAISHQISLLVSSVMREVTRVISNCLRRVKIWLGLIADLLKWALKDPDFSPCSILRRDRQWFLYHGAHPPKVFGVAAHPVFAGARVPMPAAA